MTFCRRRCVAAAFFAAATLLSSLVFAAPSARAQAQATVNCDNGQSIAGILAFLDRVPITTPFTITVNGTCNENVVIDRSKVTLVTTSGATINGPDATHAAVLVQADDVVSTGSP